MADPAGAAARRGRRVVLAACVALAAAATGCAGDGPPPAAGGAFEAIQAGIFDVACLGSGCHTSAAAAGGLVLEAGLSYAGLVGVAPDNPAARARGLLRVRPFDPAGSFLMTKLTDPAAGEGARMPLGSGPLSAAAIAQVRAWILAGAPPPGAAASGLPGGRRSGAVESAPRQAVPARLAGDKPLPPDARRDLTAADPTPTPTPTPSPSPASTIPGGRGPLALPHGTS